MQCLEDNDLDIKENGFKKMVPQMDLEKKLEPSKNLSGNEILDAEVDGSSSTEESVIHLKLSSASTRTLVERAPSLKNDEENNQKEQSNEPNNENSISSEIVNIDLNEDSGIVNIKDSLNDSKQLTQDFINIPSALKKSELDNLQEVICSTKTSKKSLKFVSYTNLEYGIVASKSLCTVDASVNKSLNSSAKSVFHQGDIINVNTAQIKTLFNTYRKPFEMNNHSDLGIRENRAIATNLKNIVSELASTFSISSDSKKGSFSSSNNYNASDGSQTTLTTSNAPNILIINSSSLFNQIYLESEQRFAQQHDKSIVINDNKQEFNYRKDTAIQDNESEKFSFRNQSEIAALTASIRPDFYKKKHVFSESNIKKDFRIDLTRVTCMKSVLSGTEDMYDDDDYKIKLTKNELWETLILALDITAKRLEDTLSEKIVSKVNKSLNILSKSINIPTLQNLDMKAETKLIGDTIRQGKVLNLRKPLLQRTLPKLDIDACLQCDIVSTSFIDEHMKKIRLEKAKIEPKLKETKIIIDNIIGQQLPGKNTTEVTDKDSPIVITKVLTGGKGDRLRRFNNALRNAIRFVIENALVIISVPSFLFMLFLLYGVILLAVKPG